ncbi:MAG: caspase family protein [Alphaproteobacteria bacterium]|nr:caspase family protein [Alphaproteobacteria bacterium]MCB9792664.1 caspase family protein [Alphaproteobacteria bacterium]
MTLLSLMLPVALAGEPPSIDAPVATEARDWRSAAVIIGVEDYEELADVEYAVADAAAMRGFMESTLGIHKSRLFYPEEADDREMQAVLGRGIARVRSRGTLWIYYAGQGAIVDGEAHIMGKDARPDQLADTMSLPELVAMANRSRAERVIIIVDASFDQRGRSEMEHDRVELGEFAVTDEKASKVVVWMPSTNGEAHKYPATGHGLFTYLALGSMRGWADGADLTPTDKQVTLAEAQAYVARQSVAFGRVIDSMSAPPATFADWVVSAPEVPLEGGPKAGEIMGWSLLDRERRIQQQQEYFEQAAQKALDDAVAKAHKGEGDGVALVQAVIDEWDGKPIVVSWTAPNPAVNKARAQLLRPEDLQPKAAPEPSATEPSVAEVDPGDGAPQIELSDDTCDDLAGMEPDALMGRFSPGRIECIEARIADEKTLQTDKDKLSRLLIANADSKGDDAAWGQYMARHLEQISRADPDMCFTYALYLSKQGIEQSEEVIRWANYALENKSEWSGEVYKKRLYYLYRLRTEAAVELWRDAEQNFMVELNAEAEVLAKKWRGHAKDYAREWLDYSRASGQDADRALQYCASAAGYLAACE